MTLDNVQLRRTACVATIEGGRGVRCHLNTLGIHVGDEVTMIEKAPFRGPVLIEIHGSRVALGRKIARKIVVETEGQLEALID
jgi:ferrous iron transport protein A